MKIYLSIKCIYIVCVLVFFKRFLSMSEIYKNKLSFLLIRQLKYHAAFILCLYHTFIEHWKHGILFLWKHHGRKLNHILKVKGRVKDNVLSDQTHLEQTWASTEALWACSEVWQCMVLFSAINSISPFHIIILSWCLQKYEILLLIF